MKPERLSVEQVLGRFVDLEDYTPTKYLLRWLELCRIEHNGMLDGEEGDFPPAIVHATQKFFQRYHDEECKIPKSRTEVDIRAEDAKYTSQETQERFQALTDLGLFYYGFPDCPPLGCMLWHAPYLPELLLQFDTLVRNWKAGVRWRRLVFLGAEQSVGTDCGVNEFVALCSRRYEQQAELRDVYNQSSLFWYAPCAGIVEFMWRLLPMPDDMRQVAVQWIAAPDRLSPDGKRKLANTQDTLAAFAQNHEFDPRCQYGLCTRAPTALRQWLITVMFLAQHLPGFSFAGELPVICAPPALPISLWVAEREASNVLWELRNMRKLGIHWRAR